MQEQEGGARCQAEECDVEQLGAQYRDLAAAAISPLQRWTMWKYYPAISVTYGIFFLQNS